MPTKIDKQIASKLVEKLNKQAKESHDNTIYGMEETDEAEKSKVFCIIEDTEEKTYI